MALTLENVKQEKSTQGVDPSCQGVDPSHQEYLAELQEKDRIIKELRKKVEDMLVRKKEEDMSEAQIAGVGLLIGTHQMPSSQGLVCVCVCV